MALSLSSTFTGRVVAVNDKGLKLEGHESWLNFSKFAADLVPPERGEQVTCTVDKSGFLRAVEVVGELPRVAGGSDAPAAGVPSTKDRTITRLAVLKAAAEYSASKPQSSSGDVLTIAASWERWVLRDAEDAVPQISTTSTSSEDNVDAF